MDPNLQFVPPQPPMEPEDYYIEGGTMVFTAAYHLKRGSCCASGCRHCPYGLAPEPPPCDTATPTG